MSDVEGVPQKQMYDSESAFAYSEDDKWMRNVWALPNRAVVMSYFCVGFAIRFLTTPISYYAVHVLGERSLLPQ